MGKGVSKYNKEYDYSGAPLILYIDKVNSCNIKTIAAYSITILSEPNEVNSTVFGRFESQCSYDEALTRLNIEDLFPYNSDVDHSIHLVESTADFSFIQSLAEHHPFGEAVGEYMLVLRRNGRRVGGAVVRSGAASTKLHNAERRLFGRNLYALKKYSTHIARLYSKNLHHRRQRDYKRLIDCILYFSDYLFDTPTSFVSGVSYDFIPAAIRAGFHVEFPIDPMRSLYYWKPIFLSNIVDSPPEIEIINKYRNIRSRRSSIKNWFVSVKDEHLNIVLNKKIWLMAEGVENNAKWRSIKPGDLVFVSSDSVTLDAIARAGTASRKSIPRFERYPLAIDLHDIRILSSPISIRRETAKAWFKQIQKGGIYPLPDEFALAVIDELRDRERKDQMWVTPNPYLLKERKFASNEKTVFVVQAWSLRETVLPLLQRICKDQGYNVTHAEDRQGQVILEDVWILINECEAVIVDFTHKRPNVYLEYGMALVLGKPIIAITQDEEDLPTDTPNLKFIKYRGDINALSDLERAIPKGLVDTISDFKRIHESEERDIL